MNNIIFTWQQTALKCHQRCQASPRETGTHLWSCPAVACKVPLSDRHNATAQGHRPGKTRASALQTHIICDDHTQSGTNARCCDQCTPPGSQVTQTHCVLLTKKSGQHWFLQYGQSLDKTIRFASGFSCSDLTDSRTVKSSTINLGGTSAAAFSFMLM